MFEKEAEEYGNGKPDFETMKMSEVWAAYWQ